MWHNTKTNMLGTETEVDMTSLMDLMTQIAAVMMLCAPPLSILSTRLPEVSGEKNLLNPESYIVVSFSGSQQIRWADEPVSLEELEKRARIYSHKKDTPEILLAGDADATYGFSIHLRTLLSKYGLKVKELARCESIE